MIHPRTLQSLEFDRIVRHLSELCLSQPGREAMLRAAPFKDETQVLAEQRLYDEAATWAARPVSDKGSAAALSDFPDVTGFLNAVEAKGAASLSYDTEAFWALKSVLVLARDIKESICVPEGEKAWPSLMALATNPPLPVQLTAGLCRCIGDDGNLRDESSPELFQIRVEMRRLHQTCLRKVRTFAEEHNILPYLQDEFMTISSDRYVLPFKANYKGRMPGVIHDWSQTGETCYFEPMFLVELNNRSQELKKEEREAEHQVLLLLASLLEVELEGAKGAVRLLTRLDMLEAKRRFAQRCDARVVPVSSSCEGVFLPGARHPLLLLAERQAAQANPNLRRGESVLGVAQRKVRPLDIELRPGERALIVTGGNAGGKTICLKTLGLIVAMTLAGIPVPVQPGAHMPWFSRVDAFIGDEQSIDDNVSTFTAQITHLSKAWKHLDDTGLILLDEFGSGTDPAQGAALAQAVLDELIEKRVFVLTATHFPALKGYAITKEGARAASMLFDSQTKRPLYSLAYDQVGASQALDVAKEHGMPEAIIRRAERYLLQDGQDATALLHKLNDLAAERAKELSTLKDEQRKARDAAARAKERMEQDRLKLYEEVRAKAQELMRAWKDEKATHKQTLKEMAKLRADLARDTQALRDEGSSVLPKVEAVKVGDSVTHVVFKKSGTVTDIDERKKRVRLDLGGVSLWADMKDIREYVKAAEAAKAKAQPKPTTQPKIFGRLDPSETEGKAADKASDAVAQSSRHAAEAAFKVDVRGMRSDTAITQIQASLDRAYLAEFHEVEVVHGRGTGALRRAIHAWLATCSTVESFELAPADRGGDGMTVVFLK